MKDRYGNRIMVAWAPHHILWIEAALTLPTQEKLAAFQDIAEMTGRSFVAVRQRASRLSMGMDEAKRRAVVRPPVRPVVLMPSELRQLTVQELMGSH